MFDSTCQPQFWRWKWATSLSNPIVEQHQHWTWIIGKRQIPREVSFLRVSLFSNGRLSNTRLGFSWKRTYWFILLPIHSLSSLSASSNLVSLNLEEILETPKYYRTSYMKRAWGFLKELLQLYKTLCIIMLRNTDRTVQCSSKIQHPAWIRPQVLRQESCNRRLLGHGSRTRFSRLVTPSFSPPNYVP